MIRRLATCGLDAIPPVFNGLLEMGTLWLRGQRGRLSRLLSLCHPLEGGTCPLVIPSASDRRRVGYSTSTEYAQAQEDMLLPILPRVPVPKLVPAAESSAPLLSSKAIKGTKMYQELDVNLAKVKYKRYQHSKKPAVLLRVHGQMLLALVKEGNAVECSASFSMENEGLQLSEAAHAVLASYVDQRGTDELHHYISRKIFQCKTLIPHALQIKGLFLRERQGNLIEEPVPVAKASDLLVEKIDQLILQDKDAAFKQCLELSELSESSKLDWSSLVHRLLQMNHVGFGIVLSGKLRSRGIKLEPRVERILFRYRVEKYVNPEYYTRSIEVEDLIKSIYTLRDAQGRWNVTRETLNVLLKALFNRNIGLDSTDLWQIYDRVFPESRDSKVDPRQRRLPQRSLLHSSQHETYQVFIQAFLARSDWASARKIVDLAAKLKNALDQGDVLTLSALNQKVSYPRRILEKTTL